MLLADELSVEHVHGLEGGLNGLGAPHVLDEMRGGLDALALLYEPRLGGHEAHGRLIVAVVGEHVRVDLVEDVDGDAAVGGGHVLVGLLEQSVEVLEDEVLGEQLVRESIEAHERVELHDAGEVAALELLDGALQALLQHGGDALRNETRQVDGAAEELYVPLLHERLVAARVRHLDGVLAQIERRMLLLLLLFSVS